MFLRIESPGSLGTASTKVVPSTLALSGSATTVNESIGLVRVSSGWGGQRRVFSTRCTYNVSAVLIMCPTDQSDVLWTGRGTVIASVAKKDNSQQMTAQKDSTLPKGLSKTIYHLHFGQKELLSTQMESVLSIRQIPVRMQNLIGQDPGEEKMRGWTFTRTAAHPAASATLRYPVIYS